MDLTDMPQDMRDVVFWNGRWKEELIPYSTYNGTAHVSVSLLNSIHWSWAGHSGCEIKLKLLQHLAAVLGQLC